MPQNKSFVLRLEIIDACLCNRLRKWKLVDIITEVNQKLEDQFGKKASKRTIQDDLKFLKDEKNAPIEAVRQGTVTYYSYTDPNYSIKNLPVMQEEVEILRDALNLLKAVTDLKLFKDVNDIISRLENTVKSTVENHESIIQFEKNNMTTGANFLDDLFIATKERSTLRLTYKSFKATQADEFIFHPYLLKEFRNRWFLIGRKTDSKQITNLALDRMISVKNSQASFIANDLFDPATYFNNTIGVSLPENESPQIIQVKVAAKQVPYIKTKPIHHSQQVISENENGDTVFGLQIINNYEFRSVLLSYGCDIEVISPDSIRASMKQILQNAFSCYS